MGTGGTPHIMNIQETDSWVESALKGLLEVGLTVGGGVVGSMMGPQGAALGAGLGQQVAAGISGEQMLPSEFAGALGTVGTMDMSKFKNPFVDPDENTLFGKIASGMGAGEQAAPAPAQNLTLEGGVPTPARIDPQARFGAEGSQIGRANTALDTMQPGFANAQVGQNLRAAVAPITFDPLNYDPQGLSGFDPLGPPVDDFGPEGRFPTQTFSPFQGEPGFQLTPLQGLLGTG